MSCLTARPVALLTGALLAASISAAAPAIASPTPSVASATSIAGRGDHGVVPTTMFGQPLMASFPNYPNGATATGVQVCDPVNNADTPLAKKRLNWMYFAPENDFYEVSADVTVTRWRDAARAFTDVVEDTGRCAMYLPLERIEWTGVDPATHALFAIDGVALAVVRDGHHVVAVVADDPSDTMDEVTGAATEALKIADRL